MKKYACQTLGKRQRNRRSAHQALPLLRFFCSSCRFFSFSAAKVAPSCLEHVTWTLQVRNIRVTLCFLGQRLLAPGLAYRAKPMLAAQGVLPSGIFVGSSSPCTSSWAWLLVSCCACCGPLCAWLSWRGGCPVLTAIGRCPLVHRPLSARPSYGGHASIGRWATRLYNVLCGYSAAARPLATPYATGRPVHFCMMVISPNSAA